MSEKYKLALSGEAMFSATPLVSFFGVYKEKFDKTELLKAFKMLSLKEPLVGAFAEVDEENNVYAVTGESRAQLVFLNVDNEEDFYCLKKNGAFDAFSHLFEFYVLNGKSLMILANGAVADIKSLFLLSERLLDFYNKKTLNITPSDVFVYSDNKDIPKSAFSVVTDKLSSDLEMKWQKHPKHFKKSDYVKLSEKQQNSDYKRIFKDVHFGKERTKAIKEYCKEKSIDVLTLLCYACKKTAEENELFEKYIRKPVYIGSDLRLFEEEPAKFGIGPFFSRVSIIKDRKKEIKQKGELKAFHDNCYKKLTNVFYAYYDKVFLSGVSPSLAVGAHFVEAGLYKNRAAKRLAKNYTALSKRFFTFDFFNLDLPYWSGLSDFSKMFFTERNSKNSALYITAAMYGDDILLFAEANEGVCPTQKLCSFCLDVIKTVDELIEFYEKTDL